MGDALGLPHEGLSRRRQRRLYPEVTGHRLVFCRGLMSDDTEHACMTAQALVVSAGDVDRFRRHLAFEMRRWLLGLPAGVGLATLRATVKLLVGVPPARSGVASAGNGPAMRSPVLGAAYGDDPRHLVELVRAATRLTHTDPRAEAGALAIAIAAAMASRSGDARVNPHDFVAALEAAVPPEGAEMIALARAAVTSVEAGETTETYAARLGCGDGVSGYMYHSVPVVVHAWLRHQLDYRGAVIAVIRCGGDTDTTAAIVGGLVGASVGVRGIPPEWISRLVEWPRTVDWIEALGARVAAVKASGVPEPPLVLTWPGGLVRNLVFLSIVLAHGFRRMLPPY